MSSSNTPRGSTTALSRARDSIGFVLFAAAALLVTFDAFVWGFGEEPFAMLKLLFGGTWGTAYGIGQVLFKATPILFTGVAVDIALRAGLFNIGAEGQVIVGSFAAAVVGASLPRGTPMPLAVTLALSGAASAGALWAFVPAFLRARYGAHEVISSIMMNRIAVSVVAYLMARGFALPGSVRTRDVVAAAKIPRLDRIVHALDGSAVSFAIVAGVGVAALSAWSFRRTKVGIEMSHVGMNPDACRAAGIPVRRRITIAFTLSGAVAALAAGATVLGYKGYYEEGLGSGAGYLGLAVALLARQRVLGFVVAALLFGTLAQGGLVVNAYVPMEVMDVLVGVVVIAVSIADARAGGVFARATGGSLR